VERYMYRAPDGNGEFRRVATEWEEYQNLVRKFAFLAESRAFDSITLFQDAVGEHGPLRDLWSPH
jgi:hypothetical protein